MHSYTKNEYKCFEKIHPNRVLRVVFIDIAHLSVAHLLFQRVTIQHQTLDQRMQVHHHCFKKLTQKQLSKAI